ncbi:MAG: copper amine oxidase N-terminal domain-containing protein [Defluviitaleaceae bacterium]|nr:copper amine oxidase N-terminal domain-containing protein [Defluviitaleaceae bacterium]
MLPTQNQKLHKIIRGVRIAIAVLAVVFVLFALVLPVLANSNIFNYVPGPGNAPAAPYASSNSTSLAEEITEPQKWDSSMLSERPLTRRQEGLGIRGTIPVISNEFVEAAFLNEHIEDVVNSLIAEARRLRARAISFSYEYHPNATNDVISLVIFADVVTTLPHTLARSVNFCGTDGSFLTVNEAVGMDIIPLAERLLEEKIRSNPERYFAALTAPFSAQTFYLSNNVLVILFDGFRLSTRVGEVDFIELNLDNISTAVLSAADYRTDGPYGLKMIPLYFTLKHHLGYDVFWCDFTRVATVSRNEQSIIELRPDDNDYIVLGTQRRSLEAPPQIIDESMYVPITFFDQVLPLTTYTIALDGSITFLSYLG